MAANRRSRIAGYICHITSRICNIWSYFISKSRNLKSCTGSNCAKQQLEGTVDSSANILLSPDLRISRKSKNSDTTRRDQSGTRGTFIPTTSTASASTAYIAYASTPVRWRAPVMAVATLLPNYYVKVPVDVNAKVLAIFSNVYIRLEAEHAVNVFIVDDNGLRAFESSQATFPIYYQQDDVSALTTSQKIAIPQGQVAWVIIQSRGQPGQQYTAVYYEVY